MKLRKHIYQLGGKWGTGVWGANVFLLIGDNLSIVDTGFKGRYKQILKQVKRLGYTPSDIASIIITHHHADHIGNLAILKETTNATVLAHAADAPYIDGRLPQPVKPRWMDKAPFPLRQLWTTTPVSVDILVNDGDELPILGGIKILHTPGHTQGSICLFLQEEQLVIAGDVLANRYKLGLPAKAYTVDITQAINSIKRVASLDFDTICFGHGSPIVHQARSIVSDFAETLKSEY